MTPKISPPAEPPWVYLGSEGFRIGHAVSYWFCGENLKVSLGFFGVGGGGGGAKCWPCACEVVFAATVSHEIRFLLVRALSLERASFMRDIVLLMAGTTVWAGAVSFCGSLAPNAFLFFRKLREGQRVAVCAALQLWTLDCPA